MNFDVLEKQMLLCQNVSQYLVRFYTCDERHAIIACEPGTPPEVWNQLK